MLPGWPLEAVGNGGPRGMVITRFGATRCGNRTRLMDCFGQLILSRSDFSCTSRKMVHDHDLWDRAVASITAEYVALPAALRGRVIEIAASIRLVKLGLHQLAAEMQGGEICASCGGECCRVGKYHVTVVDVLVFLSADLPLFAPRFGRDFCPYLGDGGCMMAPQFRPYNCVTFNCERVEGLWEPERICTFYNRDRELRALYAEMEMVFNGRFMYGLLVNYERDVVERGGQMLTYGERWLDGGND